MIVKCKVEQCPYYNKLGFCSKKEVLMIDESGMCSVLWRRGQQRILQTPYTDERYPKQDLKILTLAKRKEQIEMKQEDAAVPSEDPQNGAPA